MKPVCHFLLLRRSNKALQHARVRAAELGSSRLTVSYHPHQSIHRHHITSQSHPPSAAAAATGNSSAECLMHATHAVRRGCGGGAEAISDQTPLSPATTKPNLYITCPHHLPADCSISSICISLSRTKHRLTITTLDSGHVILLLFLSTLHFSITRNIQMKR